MSLFQLVIICPIFWTAVAFTLIADRSRTDRSPRLVSTVSLMALFSGWLLMAYSTVHGWELPERWAIVMSSAWVTSVWWWLVARQERFARKVTA
jgi:hypothetical protein